MNLETVAVNEVMGQQCLIGIMGLLGNPPVGQSSDAFHSPKPEHQYSAMCQEIKAFLW